MEQHRKDKIKWEIREGIKTFRRDWWVFLLLLICFLAGSGPFVDTVFWF